MDELNEYLASEEFISWFSAKLEQDGIVTMKEVLDNVHEHFDSDCYDNLFADTNMVGWAHDIIREKI